MGSNETREPTLAELLSSVSSRAQSGTLVCKVAKVVRYDDTKRQCDAQPCVKEWYYDEEDTKVEEALPIVCNVPVQFPSAGSLSITFPVPKGTTGILIFTDVSIDSWLTTGGTVGAGSERRHALSDAVFVPGVNPFNPAVGGASGSAVEIGTTGSCTEGAALGTALKTYLDAHTHSYVSPGGNALTTPPVTDPAGAVPDPSPTPSTTVKVSP